MGTTICPDKFPEIERHTEADHGDVCRNNKTWNYWNVGWVCPEGCNVTHDQLSPWCIMSDSNNTPCRIKTYCPSKDWILNDKVAKCYLFGRNNTTFKDAQKFCEEKGGILAEPRSNRTNLAIKQMINDNNFSRQDYWIGLTDTQTEDRFLWLSDGKEVQNTYWHKSEPNNFSGAGAEEDCVQLRNTYDYEWNDFNCVGEARLPCFALCQKY